MVGGATSDVPKFHTYEDTERGRFNRRPEYRPGMSLVPIPVLSLTVRPYILSDV